MRLRRVALYSFAAALATTLLPSANHRPGVEPDACPTPTGRPWAHVGLSAGSVDLGCTLHPPGTCKQTLDCHGSRDNR